MTENFFSLLQYAFLLNPDGPALIVPGRGEIRYRELEKWSALFARLLDSLGVCPGDRVLVQVGKRRFARLSFTKHKA